MSATVPAASAAAAVEADEARDAARDERVFLLVLAAVAALEGCGLAWFLG